MTLKEFAKMLNGREYGGEISISEEQLAKELGFVVVFGYSDDCIELRGAVDEEIGLWGSGEIGNNLLPKPIFADNCPEDYDCQWAFGTALPHESFNIYEGEELYCVGIVCDINTKPKPMTNGDRIRAMSDEELADFFMLRESVREFYRDYDVRSVIPSETLILEAARTTRIAWLHWLKQPAEVDHDTA